MRVPRVPLKRLEAGVQALERDTVHYLVRVLRLRPGDAFVAFDPARALECEATLLDASESATARFEPPRAVTERLRTLTWIQALPKGDKCDAIVRDATELGATRLWIAPSERTVVRLDAVRLGERCARWTRIAEQAARQCGRSEAPPIDVASSFVDALERTAADATRICLWERATAPLGPILADALGHHAEIAIAAGPEGGLSEAEAHRAETLGFCLASLGKTILRTETVAAAVLGSVRIWGG